MIRLIAAWFAKKTYIFTQGFQAATAELHAGLSAKLVDEKRALVAQLNTQADAIEANIKDVDAKMEKGYFECENGHEIDKVNTNAFNAKLSCPVCDATAKFVSFNGMTPAEKAQSDQERTEAERIAQNKRNTAKAEEANAKGSEDTIKFIKDQAKNGRT